jgi:hypothetical protein
MRAAVEAVAEENDSIRVGTWCCIAAWMVAALIGPCVLATGIMAISGSK